MKTAHSLAESAQLTCPNCRRTFDATVWLIVDVEERPDLAAHAAHGTIHAAPCPHCKARGQIGAPLLLYLPTAPLPGMHMLLLPTQPDDEARTQDESAWLVYTLRERLGNQWQEQWASDSVPVATPELVTAALSDDPVTAMRDFFVDLADALRDEFVASGDLDSLREAIHALEGAEVLTQPGSLDLAALLNDRGRCRWMAYDTTGDPADLDAAVADYERALPLAAAAGPPLATLLVNYGIALEDRFRLRGDPADLDAAIDANEKAVASTPRATIQWPRNLNSLALSLHERFVLRANLADLRRSVDLLHQAVDDSAPESPDLPDLRLNLAARLGDLEEVTHDRGVLNQAIDAYLLVLADATDASTERLSFLNDLAQLLAKHVDGDVASEKLDALIDIQRQVVHLSDPTDPDVPDDLAALGSRLAQRYARTQSQADLDEAIAVSQEAVAKAPADFPNLYGALVNLGSMAGERNLATNDPADLALATDSLGRVQTMFPQPNPELAALLFDLGVRWLERQAETQGAQELDRAIDCFRQAVAIPAEGAEDQAERLLVLGSALGQRFQRAGQGPDLDESIAVLDRAGELAPPNSALKGHALDQMARSLSTRYDLAESQDDLETIIQACCQALDLLPDSPERPGILSNLGTALRMRHFVRGDLQDIEDAVGRLLQAVELDAPDSPDRPPHLNNLGNALYDLYARTGGLTYLDQAIAYWQAAVDLAPPASTLQAARMNNLGDGLRTRFMHTHDLQDLERAIDFLQQAVAAVPPGSHEQARHLTNLGTALMTRHEESGRPGDLQKAMEVLTQAYDLGERYRDVREPAAFLLGVTEYSAYLDDQSPQRLDSAIAHLQQGIALTSPQSPHLANILNALSRCLESRFALTGEPAGLQAAVDAYRNACQRGAVSQPGTVLAAGRSWGDWAVERRAWQEAAEGYGFALQAMDELLSAQLLRREKESWIKDAGRIALDAADALVRSGDLPGAVVALERGRARLLAEALEHARQDLEKLPALGGADLLDRFQQASQRMDALRKAAEKPAHASSDSRGFTDDAFARAMNDAREELDAVISAIRQVPGYQDFFRPPTFAQVQRAIAQDPAEKAQTAPAGPGALVYLVPREEESFALIVNPPDAPVAVEVIRLDHLRQEDLVERLQGPAGAAVLGGYLGAYDRWRRRPSHPAIRQDWFAALEDTTRWLWDALMGPVVEHSAPTRHPREATEGDLAASAAAITPGIERPSSDEGTPRAGDDEPVPGVVLIPVGLLSLLPLHAAWTQDPDARSGRRYALDALTISYAPSARALAAARASATRVQPDSVLAIDNPDGTLDFSTLEVDAVLSYFPPDRTAAFRQGEATREAVLDHLARAAVIHLSTHGWAGWSQPLESGMLLAGRNALTLRDLLDIRLDHARLAVLSACETGVPGTELPDEVVSLPAGMLQAGVAGAVASLWSVNDLSTAMLMERFYRLWRKDAVDPAHALRQAQIWLRDTTNREMAGYFQRDVPTLAGVRMPAAIAADFYVDRMLTQNPNARDFAHPFFWGAFYLTGT